MIAAALLLRIMEILNCQRSERVLPSRNTTRRSYAGLPWPSSMRSTLTLASAAPDDCDCPICRQP